MPFNQCMLFPCELTLKTTDEGIRMFTRPVKEIERIHRKKHAWKNLSIETGDNPLKKIKGDLFHIRAEFKVGQAEEFGFLIREIPVVYNTEREELAYGKCKAILKPRDGKIALEILVDRTSIEIYGNEGRVYIPVKAFPEQDGLQPLAIFSKGGKTRVESLEIHELRSIWE